MIETAAKVPLSPLPPRQPVRDGEVGGSRRVGAHSETKCITNTFICPAAVQQWWCSAPAVGAAPAGKADPAESGGCRTTSLHARFNPPSLFCAKVRHSRQHDTRDGMQTPRLVGPPSAAASGPGPKLAARGVESNLPVQLHTPPGKAQSRR